MIKINLKESILKHIKDIEELEYEAIVEVINNPECHNPSFYDEVSFEDIVILRKELIDFEIVYQASESLFFKARNNLLKLLNKLIIERVKRIVIVEEEK
jgi:hypothetical protein